MPITKEQYLAVWRNGAIGCMILVAHDPGYWGKGNIFEEHGFDVDANGQPQKPWPEDYTDLDVARMKTRPYQEEYYTTEVFGADLHTFSAPTNSGFYIYYKVGSGEGSLVEKAFIPFADIKEIKALDEPTD